MTASLVLSAAGALAGLAIAWAATVSVARLQAVSLPLLYRLEAWMLSRWDAPFGVSVVCVARNPKRG